MIFSVLKNDPHFVKSNKSNSVFEFQDQNKEYLIRIRRKFDLSKNDNVTLEFEEHNLFQCPMWYRELVRKVEDYYYEKHKREYERKGEKLPLHYVIFLFEMVLEEGCDISFQIHDVQKDFKRVVESVDFEIWSENAKGYFEKLKKHLQYYGYESQITYEHKSETLYDVTIKID